MEYYALDYKSNEDMSQQHAAKFCDFQIFLAGLGDECMVEICTVNNLVD